MSLLPLLVALVGVLAAEVRAFEVNPVTHPEAELFELSEIDETSGYLVGPYFAAVNCIASAPDEMCFPTATVTSDADGDFIVAIPDITSVQDTQQLEDAYAEVSAYFHADRFYAHLLQFDVPPPLCFDDGLPLTIVVNARYPTSPDGTPGWIPGAVYTGECDRGIIFGQAAGADLAYDGDLIYHEVAHAAIDALSGPDVFLAGVTLRPEAVGTDPSALNEGLADFLAAGFTGDPVLGDYVEEYAGLGRRLDHDLACPATLVGDSHLDGRALAGGLYELWERHGDDFYGSVLTMAGALRSDADFTDAATTLYDVVLAQMGADAADDVEATMRARGLLACERVLPVSDVEEVYLLADPGFAPFRPPPVQLEVIVPEEPSLVTVRYSGTEFGPDWTIEALVGRGAPVGFTYTVGSPVAVEHDADETADGSSGSIEFETAAGEAVYLALFNSGTDNVALRTFTVEFDPLPSEPDNDDDADGSDDGCGCQSAPVSTTASLWLVLLAFAVRRGR